MAFGVGSCSLALWEDRPLALTPVEFDLLASLARARGWVKTRDQLLEEIRDRNYEVFDRSIEYLPIGGRH
jgi:DNA-binding response OmpR family regulator